MVGSAIRKDNAILLPTAHKHFLSLVKCSPLSGERSCRWLLKELERALGHHMTSSCKQKKHGTVLTRTGGDLMHALSTALRSQDTCTSDCASEHVTTETTSIEEKVSEVGEFMNAKL